MPLKARLSRGRTERGGYSAAWIMIGAAVPALSLICVRVDHPARFCFYLAAAAVVAGRQISLPGVAGSMPVPCLISLIGVAQLSLGETVAVAVPGVLAGWFGKGLWKQRLGQAALDAAISAASIAAAYRFYHWPVLYAFGNSGPFLLVAAALMYFAPVTASGAARCALQERASFVRTWRETYFVSFPFYLLGASAAWMINLFSRLINWQASVLLFPVIYLVHRSYRLCMDRARQDESAEKMAGLHFRTIEALALAIEAKDYSTQQHLRRVRTYAVEIGKRMGLAGPDLEALRAAAVLHDIGKLAIPEHIISKPGRLTPEEFEKMKIHPVVGAEILERVSFPYPVAPLVRAHHEKWDGSGYPSGLQGEEIPLGARILAAVDCLDALSADRPYRRALPLDEAMRQVSELSGTSFDPAVVEALGRCYREIEELAQAQSKGDARLSTARKKSSGEGPGARLPLAHEGGGLRGDFLASIAAARQEVHLLFELTQDLGNSLSVDETISVVAMRLRRMTPYDAIAVYICRDGVLFPRYVNGENYGFFSSLEIPMGEGLSGWAAANRKSVLNGNPSVEAGYLNQAARFSTLRSALVVPLEGVHGVVGALSLYRAGKDAFSRDDLRVLLAITSKVSMAVENALRFQLAEDSAGTDYLTRLPNARSLFLRLDGELARSKRMSEPLAVLVCDVNSFKRINDRFGHLEGNKVLRQVAAALRARCREYDYVARMGGDEFVILLPGGDRPGVIRRMREFQSVALAETAQDGRPAPPGFAVACPVGRREETRPLRFAETAQDGRPAPGEISLSVGAAFYPADGTDAEQLLAAADRRMYQSKRMSRGEPVAGPQLVMSAAGR